MKGDLIFYHDTDIWSRLIQGATKGPYNHVAIDCGDQTCIEATTTGIGHHTTRPLGDLYSTHVPEATAALRWLLTTVGDRYDFYDIVLAALFSIWPQAARRVPYIPDDHYICSELAAWYLRKAGYPFPSGKDTDAYFQTLSPNELYVLLEERKS